MYEEHPTRKKSIRATTKFTLENRCQVGCKHTESGANDNIVTDGKQDTRDTKIANQKEDIIMQQSTSLTYKRSEGIDTNL